MKAFRTGQQTVGITWSQEEIERATGARPPIWVRVDRGESPEGPWEKVWTGAPALSVEDTLPKRRSTYELYYWRVVVDGGGTFGPVAVFGTPDRFALEAIRLQRNHLLRDLRSVAWLFSAKREEDCPACYDPVRATRLRSNCETCGGSGKCGGYFDPVKMHISKSGPSTVQVEQLGSARMESDQTQFWTSNWPLIVPGDLVLRRTQFSLYEVVSVQRTEKHSFPIRQIISARGIDRADIRYATFEHMLRKSDAMNYPVQKR